VVLDEVGRGTSTLDGLAIAWATSEYIHSHLRARTLFATHYHELTELELELEHVSNANVAVKEWGDQIIFLHKIVPGGTDKSYGIHVARLAGVPGEVVGRAKEVLANLEAAALDPNHMPALARRAGEKAAGAQQLDIFRPANHPVLDEIRRLEPDRITPLEALAKLKEMKDELDE
jgi:DNA mismatch repair protein MutS